MIALLVNTQSETMYRQVQVIHYAVMNERHVAVHHITEDMGIRVFTVYVALIDISGDVQTHSCYSCLATDQEHFSFC